MNPRFAVLLVTAVVAVPLAVALWVSAAKKGPPDPARVQAAYAAGQALKALHAPLPDPGPNDWLSRHEESGQTYAEYVDSDPMIPDGVRRRIYVVPVGDFSSAQQEILQRTVEFVGLYFGLEVVTAPEVAVATLPDFARRKFPSGGWPQLLTTHILHDVLQPALPDDAACSIAFCADDLWPGKGWNFVFGQASLRHRVGVWSIYRNGDPAADDAMFRLCLRRTIKTATHEIGHMFSLAHCTAWACNMCGANHRAESDRNPLWLCPECLPKVLWGLSVHGAKARFERMAAFCEREGLAAEAHHFAASARLL